MEEEKDEIIYMDSQEFTIEHSTGLVHMDMGDNKPILLAFDEIEFLAKHLLQSNSINL